MRRALPRYRDAQTVWNWKSEKYHATVRLDWDGETKQWLLTTFDRTVTPSAKRTSIGMDRIKVTLKI